MKTNVKTDEMQSERKEKQATKETRTHQLHR